VTGAKKKAEPSTKAAKPAVSVKETINREAAVVAKPPSANRKSRPALAPATAPAAKDSATKKKASPRAEPPSTPTPAVQPAKAESRRKAPAAVAVPEPKRSSLAPKSQAASRKETKSEAPKPATPKAPRAAAKAPAAAPKPAAKKQVAAVPAAPVRPAAPKKPRKAKAKRKVRLVFVSTARTVPVAVEPELPLAVPVPKKQGITLFVAQGGPRRGRADYAVPFANRADALSFLANQHGLDVDEQRALARESKLTLRPAWHGAETCAIREIALAPDDAERALRSELSVAA